MTVEAGRAIWFECEKCTHGQYADYSLDSGWFDGRAVNEDYIDCEECGHENHVIEEL